AVRWVQDRTAVQRVERWIELVDPFDGKAVLEKRVVLSTQRLALVVVDSEAQAADASKRVAGELLDAVERSFAQFHDGARVLGAESVPRWRRGPPRRGQGEAAVPPARAAGDLALLVQPPPCAALRERERARAAGDAAADDGDVRAAVEAPGRKVVSPLLEP